MQQIQQLLTEHLDIWTAAETEKKSGRGRASGSAGKVYGIQKLRSLILDLAVRGKLVPQDPNDEPASELLKRIHAEKAQLVAEGKLKKEKTLAPVAEDEKPFDLPAGWEWVRIGSLGNWGAGATPLRSVASYYGGVMPWFKSGELVADFIDTAEETITDLALQECSLRLNQPGDVLLAMYGATIGKAAILKVAGTTNQAVCACTPNGSIFNEYLLLMLKAMKENFVGQGAGGAQPNISREKIIATLTALPPLPEQHRIVTKVEELMALCDQLEQEHSNAAEAHEKLVEHLLGTLTQAQNAQEFNNQWQRIYAHFDTLFTTEASIDALKQTLLQLAVMGKLVPQDPNDQPASELIKNILIIRNKLIQNEGLKTTASEVFKPDDFYIRVPTSWTYCRLGNLAKFIDYRGKTPNKVESGIPLITAKNVRQGYINREPEEFVTTQDYDLWMTRGFPRVGDMLFTTEAPLGNIALIDITEKFALAQRVICFQLHNQGIGRYLKIALMSNRVQQQFEREATGMTATGIKASNLKEIPIPIPPLAEQHRIVAKVDELMALCDQLKTRIQQASQQQQQLADVLVAQAVA